MSSLDIDLIDDNSKVNKADIKPQTLLLSIMLIHNVKHVKQSQEKVTHVRQKDLPEDLGFMISPEDLKKSFDEL